MLSNMSRQAARRSLQLQLRNQASSTIRAAPLQIRHQSTQWNTTTRTTISRSQCVSFRYLHTSRSTRIGLMSDEDTETPREAESHEKVTRATPLTDKEFHKHADEYISELLTKLEVMHDKQEVLDVEYSVC